MKDGRRRIDPSNGVAGGGQAVSKGTGLRKKQRPTIRRRVRRLREPSLPAPLDRISDPQIPPTKLILRAIHACAAGRETPRNDQYGKIRRRTDPRYTRCACSISYPALRRKTRSLRT